MKARSHHAQPVATATLVPAGSSRAGASNTAWDLDVDRAVLDEHSPEVRAWLRQAFETAEQEPGGTGVKDIREALARLRRVRDGG